MLKIKWNRGFCKYYSVYAPATFTQNIQINDNIKNTEAIRKRNNSIIMNKVNKAESCLIIEPDSNI